MPKVNWVLFIEVSTTVFFGLQLYVGVDQEWQRALFIVLLTLIAVTNAIFNSHQRTMIITVSTQRDKVMRLAIELSDQRDIGLAKMQALFDKRAAALAKIVED